MPRKKRKIAVIDAETDPFKYGRAPKPFCWGYYDGTFYQQFWGDNATEQLLEFLSTEEPQIIYAHNGGKFDFFYLLQWLDPEIFLINGRISKAFLFDLTIELRDSWLSLPLPLASHDKNEIDYRKLERSVRDTHKSEILDYLRKDCTSLYSWITQFVEQFGNKLTLASVAFDQLRKTGYDIGRTYEDFDTTFRDFYYGGRVQCIEVGSFYQPFKVLDIRSAYPDAMTHNHWYGSQYIETFRFPDGENGSWYADIDAVSRGALPFKYEEKSGQHKLFFPDDNTTRNYKVSGWEILSGLKNNKLHIKKINRVYRPILTENFKTYVDTFFKMKSEADFKMKLAEEKGDKVEALYWAAQRQFAKILLNSCYGKFGQDGRKFEEFYLADYGDWPELSEREKAENKSIWKPYVDLEIIDKSVFFRPAPIDKFFNVATAGSITGFVRAKLFDAICNSERGIYCDTDSLTCLDSDVLINDELGAWECEANLVEMHIAQRKLYAGITDQGKYKIAAKGVNLGKKSDPKVQKKIYDMIKNGIAERESYHFKIDSPAFNLKLGAVTPRFFDRTINFKYLEKNACKNPEEYLYYVQLEKLKQINLFH